MKKTWEFIKEYHPLLSLIVCAYIYATQFPQRFILPIDDEARYVKAQFSSSLDWSPGYQFYYHLVNSLTLDQYKSVYYTYFSFSIILIPLTTFMTLRNLKFNIQSSALVAIFSLLASWNFPNDQTKIQIFNYLFLLFAFNLRWFFIDHKIGDKIKAKYTLFYFLLILSIFIRQDNLLIVIVAFLWDLYHSKNSSTKKLFFLSVGLLIAFFLKLFVFSKVFSSERSVLTVLDHFWFTNPELFLNYRNAHISHYAALQEYFGNPTSLWQIATHRPEAFFHHISQNLRDLPKLTEIFSLNLYKDWRYPFFLQCFFALITLYVFKAAAKDTHRINYKEIQLFSLAFLIKCLTITILLSWWIKYYFELGFIAMIWLMILLQKFKSSTFFLNIKSFKRPFLINLGFLLIPYALLCWNFHPTPEYMEKNLDKVVLALREEHKKYPVKNIISGNHFYTRPFFEIEDYNPYSDDKIEKSVREDLIKFINVEKIDTVILYPFFKTKLYGIGLKEQIDDFETNFTKYGFEIHYAQDQQIIYRLRKDIYEKLY